MASRVARVEQGGHQRRQVRQPSTHYHGAGHRLHPIRARYVALQYRSRRTDLLGAQAAHRTHHLSGARLLAPRRRTPGLQRLLGGRRDLRRQAGPGTVDSRPVPPGTGSSAGSGHSASGLRPSLSTNAQQAREAFGLRLREIRKDAELSGRALAGWHFTKVSKIESGKRAPSDADIRAWCEHCHAQDQVPDLIASLRNIESQYVEWRRALRAGTKRRQEIQRRWEHEAQLLRIYEPLLIPGILQTAAYATKIVQTAVGFYGIPNDVQASVDTRLSRQDALYEGIRRFHIVMGEQALRTRLGDIATMQGQLGRLLEASTLPRLRLAIIPTTAVYQVWPIHGFWIFDQRMVRIETYAAELTIIQPRELALYVNAFDGLARSAVYGQEARSLITQALGELTEDSE